MGRFDLFYYLDLLPGIVLGLTFHEAAHAWTASQRGDKTAEKEGRVTLDPFRHIDVLGLIVLFVAGFGWAKPVHFQKENLKNPRVDTALIAGAGPLTNLLLALALSFFYAFLRHQIPWTASQFDASLLKMVYLAVLTNWGLFLFNLIPLPPLDGSHILFPQWTKTPRRTAFWGRWGSYALFGLILFQNFSKVEILPISPAVKFLSTSFFHILGVA